MGGKSKIEDNAAQSADGTLSSSDLGPGLDTRFGGNPELARGALGADTSRARQAGVIVDNLNVVRAARSLCS